MRVSLALPPRSVMSGVQSYVDHQVLLLTQDGRVIVGVLEGYDSNGTIVMSSCVERMFSEDAPVEEVPLGVYIVRGDSMYVSSTHFQCPPRSHGLGQGPRHAAVLHDRGPHTRRSTPLAM